MKLIKQGKVRDIYEVDQERLLLLATDRLSAYDVIFPDPFPGKGVVLTALSRWWLDRAQAIVPTHHTVDDRAYIQQISNADWLEIDPRYRKDLAERAMIVERCEVIPFECVVRGFAFGSYLKDHPGVKPMSRFKSPLFTPSTKAAQGHDMPVTFGAMRETLGAEADTLHDLAVELFRMGEKICLEAGIVLVDTKFEFGHAKDGTIKLIDECFTPDSSRFILKEDFDNGRFNSYDKQVVRDYVDHLGWNRQPPAPSLPSAIIDQTLGRYRAIRDRLTGVPK